MGIFDINGNNLETIKTSAKNLATIFVSASDSSDEDKNSSNYVCTGVNDQAIIQNAIDNLPFGGRVILANGTYNIDGFSFESSGYKVAFGERGGNQRNISIEGMNPPARKINGKNPTQTAIINVTSSCLNSLNGFSGRVSVLGYNGLSRQYPKYTLTCKNLAFLLQDNQHSIICVDAKYYSALFVENVQCFIYSDGTTTDGADYQLPNPDCIAIRGLDGSNLGTGYRISNCFVFGFGVAYDINGEHLIMEQCGTRFCDYSYRFGKDRGTGANLHDLTLINCCHEFSRRYPYFCGVGQAINFINYNVEEHHSGTFAHLSRAYEDSDGSYYGDITYTISNSSSWQNISGSFFEEGSGSRFKARNLVDAV